jgi:MOSC domain-containing protein YiiM
MVSENELELVKEKGIVGDKAFGSRNRQVLLVEEEILLKYSLSPGDLRENIVSTKLRISELKSETLLQIGEAILKITGDCAPCAYIDDLQEGLQNEIRGNRGALAIVELGAKINIGDPIKVLDNGA